MSDVSLEEWQAEGTSLWGQDPRLWCFACPACGRRQSVQDFMLLGMPIEMAQQLAGYTCIDRWRSQTCMLTAVGPVRLIISDDPLEIRPTFDWAPPLQP